MLGIHEAHAMTAAVKMYARGNDVNSTFGTRKFLQNTMLAILAGIMHSLEDARI